MSTPTLPQEPERRMVSLRLTAEARQILQRLSQESGVSQAAVLEGLLRGERNTGEVPRN